ncbi:MAG: hypothetical protein QF570_11190 [Myxococcota bacterium]|jgi:hypothetical protein|nr:hypothetical protein [Myxococcota bacterium]
MTSFDSTFAYDRDGFAVRDTIQQVHRTSWQQIANAGSYFTGEQRLEIARQARATRAKRGDPSWLREGLPDAEGRLSEVAVDAARTIAADAHKIDSEWAAKKIAALGDGAYVELISIVACMSAIDAYSEALGRAHEPLPDPQPGEPDGGRLAEATDAGAHVPMIDPFTGPNVARALSLVPSANQLFFANVMAMYSNGSGGFYDMEWGGPLDRPQAELIAARVSAVNECFY